MQLSYAQFGHPASVGKRVISELLPCGACSEECQGRCEEAGFLVLEEE